MSRIQIVREEGRRFLVNEEALLAHFAAALNREAAVRAHCLSLAESAGRFSQIEVAFVRDETEGEERWVVCRATIRLNLTGDTTRPYPEQTFVNRTVEFRYCVSPDDAEVIGTAWIDPKFEELEPGPEIPVVCHRMAA